MNTSTNRAFGAFSNTHGVKTTVASGSAGEYLAMRSAQLLALSNLTRTETFNGLDPITRGNIALLLHSLIDEVNSLIPIALDEACPEPICRQSHN